MTVPFHHRLVWECAFALFLFQNAKTALAFDVSSIQTAKALQNGMRRPDISSSLQMGLLQKRPLVSTLSKRIFSSMQGVKDDDTMSGDQIDTNSSSQAKIREMASFLVTQMFEKTLAEVAKGKDSKFSEEQALELLSAMQQLSPEMTSTTSEDGIQPSTKKSDIVSTDSKSQSEKEATPADNVIESKEKEVNALSNDYDMVKAEVARENGSDLKVGLQSQPEEIFQRTLLETRLKYEQSERMQKQEIVKEKSTSDSASERKLETEQSDSLPVSEISTKSDETVLSPPSEGDLTDDAAILSHLPTTNDLKYARFPDFISKDFGKPLEIIQADVPPLREGSRPVKMISKSDGDDDDDIDNASETLSAEIAKPSPAATTTPSTNISESVGNKEGAIEDKVLASVFSMTEESSSLTADDGDLAESTMKASASTPVSLDNKKMSPSSSIEEDLFRRRLLAKQLFYNTRTTQHSEHQGHVEELMMIQRQQQNELFQRRRMEAQLEYERNKSSHDSMGESTIDDSQTVKPTNIHNEIPSTTKRAQNSALEEGSLSTTTTTSSSSSSKNPLPSTTTTILVNDTANMTADTTSSIESNISSVPTMQTNQDTDEPSIIINLQEKYASIEDLGERAFVILQDLGMI